MADNTELASGSGGDTIRTEDRTTYKTPVSLIDVGGSSAEALIGDGSNAMPVGGLAAENAAVAGNPVLVGGRYDLSARTLGDGDVGAVALNASGHVIVAGTVAVSGTVTVGAHAVTNAGTFAVQVDGTALTRLTDIETNTDFGAVTGGGTETGALRVTIANNSTGIVSVDDNGGSLTVDDGGTPLSVSDGGGTITVDDGGSSLSIDDNGGSITVDGTVAVSSLPASTNTIEVVGDVAHDAVAAGNPLLMGAYASASAPTAVATGDATRLWATTSGALNVADGGGSLTVDNGGTFAVQLTGGGLTALQLIDNVVVTHDAAGGTPTGNMICGVRDDEVGATAVTSADGDVSALRVDKFGALKVTQLPDATSEVKRAVIAASSSGDNTLVAAAGAGVKIRVLAVAVVAAGDVDARFESGASGTALTGVMDLTTNSGFVLPFNPMGWFETADNTLLNLELSGATSVAGCLTYVEV